MDVLDVACGTGNATIPAAKLAARVTGLDFSPGLIEIAREQGADAMVEVDWIVGDAQDTALRGRLLRPRDLDLRAHVRARPRAPAEELTRVCRPGGRIAIACWTPEGTLGQMFKRMSAFHPPPPDGFQPPVLWGTEDHVRELLGDGVEVRAPRRRVGRRVGRGLRRLHGGQLPAAARRPASGSATSRCTRPTSPSSRRSTRPTTAASASAASTWSRWHRRASRHGLLGFPNLGSPNGALVTDSERRPFPLWTGFARVVRTELVTPRMKRITLTAPEFADFGVEEPGEIITLGWPDEGSRARAAAARLALPAWQARAALAQLHRARAPPAAGRDRHRLLPARRPRQRLRVGRPGGTGRGARLRRAARALAGQRRRRLVAARRGRDRPARGAGDPRDAAGRPARRSRSSTSPAKASARGAPGPTPRCSGSRAAAGSPRPSASSSSPGGADTPGAAASPRPCARCATSCALARA